MFPPWARTWRQWREKKKWIHKTVFRHLEWCLLKSCPFTSGDAEWGQSEVRVYFNWLPVSTANNLTWITLSNWLTIKAAFESSWLSFYSFTVFYCFYARDCIPLSALTCKSAVVSSLQHIVKCHGSTLLPQFLGMYRVSVDNEETYLIVMRNMFSHRLVVHRKYDLKVRRNCTTNSLTFFNRTSYFLITAMWKSCRNRGANNLLIHGFLNRSV